MSTLPYFVRPASFSCGPPPSFPFGRMAGEGRRRGRAASPRCPQRAPPFFFSHSSFRIPGRRPRTRTTTTAPSSTTSTGTTSTSSLTSSESRFPRGETSTSAGGLSPGHAARQHSSVARPPARRSLRAPRTRGFRPLFRAPPGASRRVPDSRGPGAVRSEREPFRCGRLESLEREGRR